MVGEVPDAMAVYHDAFRPQQVSLEGLRPAIAAEPAVRGMWM